MELSALSRVISPTLSRQLFMMAKQYDDVVDFTLGDPDVPTPKPICEAAINAAYKGYTRYAPNAGLPELRDAIAKQVSSESGLSYEGKNVAVTIGATEAVYLSFMAYINPGDETILQVISIKTNSWKHLLKWPAQTISSFLMMKHTVLWSMSKIIRQLQVIAGRKISSSSIVFQSNLQ